MKKIEQEINENHKKERTRPIFATFILVVGSILLLLVLAASVSLGAASITFSTVWEAVFNFNPDLTSHQIIEEVRLPRALTGALVRV